LGDELVRQRVGSSGGIEALPESVNETDVMDREKENCDRGCLTNYPKKFE